MSKCISRHGEFSSHEPSEGYCTLCGASTTLEAIEQMADETGKTPAQMEAFLAVALSSLSKAGWVSAKQLTPEETRKLFVEFLGSEE